MTGLWANLEWRSPAWLALALVPWVAWAWRRWRRTPARSLTRYADPHLWPWLLVGTPHLRGFAAVAGAWLLASIAAAGPAWKSLAQQEQARRGIDIAAVVDISPSMLVTDVAPSRLARAKLELRDFTDFLHGDRVALIPFSANAYLTLPLTHDKDAFMYFVNALEPQLVSKTGSDLQRALDLAGRTLQGGGKRGKAVVLLTDGENHGMDALDTARRLGKAGIPLYVLGMGTVDGGPVPNPQGQFLKYQGSVVVSHLARARLRELAAASGGEYVDLRDDDGDWTALFNAMRRSVPENSYSITTARPTRELFPWFAALSLALFLLSGVSRANPALPVLCLLLPALAAPPPAHASPWREQAALRALDSGEYARAARIYGGLDNYTGHLGAGAAAYRLRDYAKAAAEFRRATVQARDGTELARAAYDLGNAYAHLGQFDRAGDAYQRALRARPNYPHAALNLTLIRAAQQHRLGNRESKRAKRGMSLQGGAARRWPTTNRAGKAPSVANSLAQSTAAPGQPRDSAAAPPEVDIPTPLLKQWNIKPGQVNEDLSAALQQVESLQAQPNALMSFFYSEEDVKAGILPQEKPW